MQKVFHASVQQKIVEFNKVLWFTKQPTTTHNHSKKWSVTESF